MKQNQILITKSSADYELIDSGEGEKLERFGQFTLARPDPQALWLKNLPKEEWKKASASFTRDENQGSWVRQADLPDRWLISLAGLKFWIKPTAFKHVGLFPEQEGNWEWLKAQIEKSSSFAKATEDKKIKNQNDNEKIENEGIEVLNLFGYTGGATLACAEAGAKVVHIDGSKAAMTWARENAELSGLEKKPVRWILEDARAFVKKELKRGRTYAGIILDPPAFGHGPDNELWKIEEDLLPLIKDCFALLQAKPLDDARGKPLFFLINGYSAGYSALAYENILGELVAKHGGKVEAGELTIEERSPTSLLLPVGASSYAKAMEDTPKGKHGEKEDENVIKTGTVKRLLPCGIFARWSL
ncbi:MAG: class I SAM-dependent methyltransferase [Candidatus Paceibacterota bacterium]